MPKKERGAFASARGHRQSKTGMTAEESPARKEKTERRKVAVDPDADGKVKTTVVDIDAVRDDEVKDESVGVLEAAEQDGKRESMLVRLFFSHLWCFSPSELLVWVSAGLKHRNLGVFEWLLMVFVLALVLLFFPLSIWFCFKVCMMLDHTETHRLQDKQPSKADHDVTPLGSQVVREHERAVIFRMGHLLRGRPRGPGCYSHISGAHAPVLTYLISCFLKVSSSASLCLMCATRSTSV